MSNPLEILHAILSNELENINSKSFAGKVETAFSEKEKIEIPKTMNKLQAAKELERQWKEEESIVRVVQNFENYYPDDVLNAFTEVFKEQFGWIDSQAISSFFTTRPPMDFKIKVDVDQYKSVFHGKMNVSGWDNAEIKTNVDGFTGVTSLIADVKKRFKPNVDNLFLAVFDYLQNKSIFKNKTVVVAGPKNFNFPHFDIIENVPNSKIHLNDDVASVITNFILPEIHEKLNKRIYLFTGSYGNGKTETAMKIGNFATGEGYTFIYCKDSAYFEFVLKLHKNYSPMLVFLEDIDEIGSGEQRDSKMNFLLNTLDGIESKSSNLKVIFTTNHQEKINQALRRPGRIDIVLDFQNPDKETVKKIYTSYLKKFEGFDSLDLDLLANETPDVQGAFVAEIAKRAERIAEREGNISNGYVKASINSILPQVKLMQSEVKSESKDMILYKALETLIRETVDPMLENH